MLGSVGLIGFLLWKLGYAKNYAARNPSLRRQLVGLSLGFLLALGFFLSLTNIELWLPPVVIALIALGLVIAIRKVRF